MLRFFKLPFPRFSNKQLVLIVTVCVFIFVVILALDLSSYTKVSLGYYAKFIIGYTAVTLVCTSIITLLFSIIFKKKWTMARFFILGFIITLSIWICNSFFYYFFLNKDNFSFYYCLYDHIITFLIGIICTGLGYLWIKNKYLDSNLRETTEMNSKLTFRVLKETSEQKMITLSGISAKDSLTLFPQELIYIESTGNYVRIFYERNGKIQQTSFLATLSKMEDTLSDCPFLVRCHRAFIVNLLRIEKITGSKIQLKSVATEIPISRSCKNDVKNRIISSEIH